MAVINLGSNQLTGYTPGALTGLTRLQRIDLSDNLLDPAAVDALIDDLYQDRDVHTFTSSKYLALESNAAPSAAACLQVATLRASYGWTITVNGC